MTIVTCPTCGTKNRVDEARLAQGTAICGKCKSTLPAESVSSDPVHLTDANFDAFLASAGDKPVLVDFWADWCQPCKLLGPTIDALAKESNGRWLIAKLDTQENQQIAGKFRIDAIPTMLIFKSGEPVDQFRGLQPKQAILSRLEAHAKRG